MHQRAGHAREVEHAFNVALEQLADDVVHIAARTKLTEKEARQTIERMSPQRRMVEVDEVAALVLMLADEEARGITGQGINVDGGGLMD